MGLQKLFGKKVFNILTQVEAARVKEIIDNFLENGGKIVCFQKDAYNALVDNAESKYDIHKAVNGELTHKINDQISLIGIPPTRWLYTAKMKSILKQISSSFLSSTIPPAKLTR